MLYSLKSDFCKFKFFCKKFSLKIFWFFKNKLFFSSKNWKVVFFISSVIESFKILISFVNLSLIKFLFFCISIRVYYWVYIYFFFVFEIFIIFFRKRIRKIFILKYIKLISLFLPFSFLIKSSIVNSKFLFLIPFFIILLIKKYSKIINNVNYIIKIILFTKLPII